MILFLLLVLPLCMSFPVAAALAQEHRVFDEGAITRMDTTRREIYLVFTGHEFAEGFALSHVGAGPGRTDKFYLRLDSLLTILSRRGYRFNRLPGARSH